MDESEAIEKALEIANHFEPSHHAVFVRTCARFCRARMRLAKLCPHKWCQDRLANEPEMKEYPDSPFEWHPGDCGGA